MNPYNSKSESELQIIHDRVNPNRDIIHRKKLELLNRPIWKTANPEPAQLEAFKKELDEYLEELILYQDGISAAVAAVNRLNGEMFAFINTK